MSKKKASKPKEVSLEGTMKEEMNRLESAHHAARVKQGLAAKKRLKGPPQPKTPDPQKGKGSHDKSPAEVDALKEVRKVLTRFKANNHTWLKKRIEWARRITADRNEGPYMGFRTEEELHQAMLHLVEEVLSQTFEGLDDPLQPAFFATVVGGLMGYGDFLAANVDSLGLETYWKRWRDYLPKFTPVKPPAPLKKPKTK